MIKKTLNKINKFRYFSTIRENGLSAEELEIQKSALEFGNQFIMPNIQEWDRDHYFPKEIVKKSAEFGFAGIYTSADYGGCELKRIEASLIFEALAESSVNISAYISIHNMNCWFIDTYGSEFLKSKYLSEMTQFNLFSSYCLTEPNSGSDAGSMKTSAKQQGDNFVINGSKVFISGGGMSDVYIVMCKTGDKEVSAFIVEKDSKGLSFGKNELKMGWHCSPTTMVMFDDVVVPKENMIGQQGSGFKYAMSALDGGRVNIASTSLGAANYCYGFSKDYMKQRKQFGKQLSEFQYLQFKQAEIATKLVSSQLMIRNAARMIDENNPNKTMYCAMAKMYGTDNCFNIVNDCLQMLGGYGYLQEYQIERYLRDIRVNQILEGTNEVMRLIIARSIFKD